MEAQLTQLLASAKQAVEAFEGPLAGDVDAALSLSPDDASAQSGALRAKIEESIQTLHKLERLITPPQVLFMDAIFGKSILRIPHTITTDLLTHHQPPQTPKSSSAPTATTSPTSSTSKAPSPSPRSPPSPACNPPPHSSSSAT